MKRVSKYEGMVGTEINGVLVSNYRRIEKVSKTSGRKYYRYEVELNNVLWVSTTSFKNMSYGKRLAKAMGKANIKKCELVLYNEFPRDFIGKCERIDEIEREFFMCDTVAEVRKLFKRYSRYLHPDMGNNLVADEYGWRWLCSTRDATIAQIEFWYDDEE